MAQATRPIFLVCARHPYSVATNITFPFYSGLSAAQKQRNVESLHASFSEEFPEKKVLEISTKSLQAEGVPLSAFNLKKFVPSLGKSVPVECVYQGSKVFANGGPYTDLYEKSAKAAKADARLTRSGELIAFEFEGVRYPIRPRTIFYDYIYISALLENRAQADELMKFDGFSDIEFNPKTGINCQAHAAARFVSLSRMGLLDGIGDFDVFRGLIDLRRAA